MKKKVIVTVYLIMSMSVVSAAQTSLNFSYDQNGNLIQDNDFVYEYNDWNQMIRMRLLNGSIVSEYSYDNEGNRYKKVANSTNETTYYPNENFIQSRNSTGLFETFFYYEGDTLVGRKDPNGSVYYYHSDHLGSTDVITTSGGAVFEDMDYLPFGDELTNSTSRYLYTGKELDRESDLDYFDARYYSPYLMQFVQPDTIIPEVYNPQSLNRYAYVLNNPYKYTDPSGKQLYEISQSLVLGTIFLFLLIGKFIGSVFLSKEIREEQEGTEEVSEDGGELEEESSKEERPASMETMIDTGPTFEVDPNQVGAYLRGESEEKKKQDVTSPGTVTSETKIVLVHAESGDVTLRVSSGGEQKLQEAGLSYEEVKD